MQHDAVASSVAGPELSVSDRRLIGMRHPRDLTQTLAVASLLLLLSGCGEPSVSSFAHRSGIEGTVMVDAGCTMTKGSNGCSDRPLAALLRVTERDNTRVVASVDSHPDGTFHLVLPPGAYAVHPSNLTGSPVPTAPTYDVSVRDGVFTTLHIQFDSGIR